MIEIGEVRQDMANKLTALVEQVINNKKNLAIFYIVIYCKLESENVGVTKVVLLSRAKGELLCTKFPEGLLGTAFYKIDNRNGIKERLWFQPLDVPIPGQIQLANPNDMIIQEVAGKNIPIYWH